MEIKLNKTCIYVVTHKKVDLTSLALDPCYKLIRVGAYAREESPYDADNTGDNIAEKNPNYCELTAHYWMWKNSTADIIGLCHYRRFLTSSKMSENPEQILHEDSIRKDLETYDIIMPYRPVARRTVKQIYLDFGFEKDLEILRTVIKEKSPQYLAEYDALMNRHSNYPANILICKKELFDEYSAWLFDILFEVEKRTDLTGYTAQQARIYGFMSERLLEIWVRCRNLKIKHYRVLQTEKKYNMRMRITDLLSMLGNPFQY